MGDQMKGINKRLNKLARDICPMMKVELSTKLRKNHAVVMPQEKTIRINKQWAMQSGTEVLQDELKRDYDLLQQSDERILYIG